MIQSQNLLICPISAKTNLSDKCQLSFLPKTFVLQQNSPFLEKKPCQKTLDGKLKKFFLWIPLQDVFLDFLNYSVDIELIGAIYAKEQLGLGCRLFVFCPLFKFFWCRLCLFD